jgi:hypothetical protein
MAPLFSFIFRRFGNVRASLCNRREAVWPAVLAPVRSRRTPTGLLGFDVVDSDPEGDMSSSQTFGLLVLEVCCTRVTDKDLECHRTRLVLLKHG